MKELPDGGSSADRPQRIKNMLESGRLREQPATRPQVAAVWQKAVESARDAELEDLSIDGALRSAYDAGHLATQALLAAHGLRAGGGAGHHEATFAAAAALDHEGLEDLLPDSIEVRSLRKGSLYDPVIAGPDDRERALEWMRRTLPAIRRALLETDPSLAPILKDFP